MRLVVLGSSSLVATDERRPTQLAVLGGDRNLLIDCGLSPRDRLEKLGFGRDSIDDIFITHFHPDHAAGLPQFLMELNLLGRKKPIRVLAAEDCLRRIRETLDLYEWSMLPPSMPVEFRPVDYAAGAEVLSTREFCVTAAPVRHVVPTLGIRIAAGSGRTAVFSSDTEPAEAIVDLARGADVLLHEATGEGVGHSSAAQAGEIARKAGARRLILIHTDPYADRRALAAEASATFGGKVEVASDLMEIGL